MSRKSIAILPVLLFLIICSSSGFSEVIDKILAIVNDEVITQREIDRKALPIMEHYKTLYGEEALPQKTEELNKAILEQLINEKLVISEAKRKGMDVSDEEINEELNKIKKGFKNDEEFYLTLDKQGISIRELKENYKSSLMAKNLISIEVGSKVSFSPIEIIDYYENHKDELMTPESALARMILIKIKEKTPEETLKTAEDIKKRLENGEDFAAIAEAYSDGLYASSGGDMGYVKKGEMIEHIDNIIFNLKSGEISEIVKTDLGYHIFKVEDKKESELKTFNDAKGEIEKIIFNKKIEERLNAYLQKLKSNAYIAYK